MTILQFREYIKSSPSSRDDGTKCLRCRVPIIENITGIQSVSAGFMCDDCYYQIMGDEIEQFPVHRPTDRNRHREE